MGRVDGVAFDGGTATDVELVIGSGQFIPGFEAQLTGAKPDTDVTVEVTFPADYQSSELKFGKFPFGGEGVSSYKKN